MDNLFIIIFLLYIFAFVLGPRIANKVGVNKKVFLNTSYTKFKSKYVGYVIIILSLIGLLYENVGLFTLQGYYILMEYMVGILLGLSLILRNDVYNQVYSRGNEKSDNIYLLDFIKSSFIPFIILILLINFLSYQTHVILVIITMAIMLVELIVFILSLCPDKIEDYFKLNNYTFGYSQYFYIVLIASILPAILMLLIIIILSVL